MRLKEDWQATLAALLFGGSLPLAFAPWNWWIVALFATTGLAVLLQNSTARVSFRRSLCFGIGFFGSGASWVYVSIATYGNSGVFLAVLLTALFVLLLALIFALPFYLLGYLHNNHPIRLLLGFPSIWVLGEMLRGWLFTGFPWLYLGYGFTETLIGNWGAVLGVFGVSWMIAFSGALLAVLKDFKLHRSSLELGAFAVLIFIAGGLWVGTKSWTVADNKPVSVGLMQPAIPLPEKWDAGQLHNTLATYDELNAQLLGNDLIVWPESAIPALQQNIQPFLGKLNKLMLDRNIALITGIPSRDQRSGKYYNSVIGLGMADGRYDKQHLVPFGEYVPLESLLRGLIGFFDLPMSNFSSGRPDQPLITASGHRVGISICYEIAYPNLVRKAAKDADFLLTVSNDAWFGGSIGPHQHLQIAQMRAIENGKPLIRATNDGVTAIIDQRGRITATMPQFIQGVAQGWVAPHRGTTPYNQFGNTPTLLAILFLLISSAFIRDKKPPSRHARQ